MLFQLSTHWPKRPLVAREAPHRTRNGCVARRRRVRRSGRRLGQDTDIGQDAQFPQDVDEFHVAWHHLLCLSMY